MVKSPATSAGDTRDVGLISGREDPSEKEMAADSSVCLGNPMDGGAWRAAVCGIARVGHALVTKQPQGNKGSAKVRNLVCPPWYSQGVGQ